MFLFGKPVMCCFSLGMGLQAEGATKHLCGSLSKAFYSLIIALGEFKTYIVGNTKVNTWNCVSFGDASE